MGVKNTLKNIGYKTAVAALVVASVGTAVWGAGYLVSRALDKRDYSEDISIRKTRLDTSIIRYSKHNSFATITIDKGPWLGICTRITGGVYWARFTDSKIDGKVDQIEINDQSFERNTSNEDLFLKADKKWAELCEELDVDRVPEKRNELLEDYLD